MVKDAPLRDTWRMLNDKVVIPSDNTVARDVHMVYKWAKPKVIEFLKVRRVHIYSDLYL